MKTNTPPQNKWIGKQERTTEYRIEVLKIQEEETEQELKCLCETLKKIKELNNITKPNTTSKQELELFIKRIEKQIEINTDIKEEYKQSIEFIKNG